MTFGSSLEPWSGSSQPIYSRRRANVVMQSSEASRSRSGGRAQSKDPYGPPRVPGSRYNDESMPSVLDPDLRRALAERVRYCHEMGIYDFYRREPQVSGAATATAETEIDDLSSPSQELREEMAARKSAVVAKVADQNILRVMPPNPEQGVTDPVAALKLIREDLGDCIRCKLHQQGRKQIVFGVGNPRAELMFVGEGPGADEDTQGEPFVGRAGQLLNNMIKAMGIRREDVYIANIVKCRPPGNRTPERDECETCSPFLMRQIAV